MATTTANPNVFDVPGTPIKSAERDPFGRLGVTELFARPLITDLNRALSGDIDLDVTPRLGADGIGPDTLTLIRTSGVTYATPVADMVRSQLKLRSFVTADDLGLTGNGATDDAPALQRGLDLWGSRGGASFYLQAQPGQTFLFKGKPTLRSGCSVHFGSPASLGRHGGVRIGGKKSNALPASLRLLEDVAVGATTLRLDTTLLGGDAISTFLAVDDRLSVYGIKDSAGFWREVADMRVTAINDGASTVTIASGSPFAFRATYPVGDYETAWGEPDRTIIEKQVVAFMAEDLAEGSTLVAVQAGQAGRFSPGDLVLVEDDKTAGDAGIPPDGSVSTSRLRIEPVRIDPSLPDDPADTLRLARRVQRTFETAFRGRVIKLDAVERSSIVGLSVEFIEPPDPPPASRSHTFELAYADACELISCDVPNTDIYGTRGAAFRLFRSHNCLVQSCSASKGKYVDSGDGNGLHFDNSYGCSAIGFRASNMRHAVEWNGATDCNVYGPILQAGRHTVLDWHGSDSRNCVAYNVTLTAGTAYEANPGISPAAITFGNPSHLGGDRFCGVSGGRVTGFISSTGSYEPAVVFFGGSTDCFVEDVDFVRCAAVARCRDLNGNPTVLSIGNRIENCTAEGCTQFAVEVNGRHFGASADAVQDFTVRNLRLRGCARGLRMANATETQILGVEIDDSDFSTGEPYALRLEQLTGLIVRGCLFRGLRRGVLMNGVSTFEILRNDFVRPVADTLVLVAVGTNSGTWARNEYVGFTPTTSGALVGFAVANDDLPLPP